MTRRSNNARLVPCRPLLRPHPCQRHTQKLITSPHTHVFLRHHRARQSNSGRESPVPPSARAARRRLLANNPQQLFALVLPTARTSHSHRLCTEQSLSYRWTALPWVSAKTCTSTCRGSFTYLCTSEAGRAGWGWGREGAEGLRVRWLPRAPAPRKANRDPTTR